MCVLIWKLHQECLWISYPMSLPVLGFIHVQVMGTSTCQDGLFRSTVKHSALIEFQSILCVNDILVHNSEREFDFSPYLSGIKTHYYQRCCHKSGIIVLMSQRSPAAVSEPYRVLHASHQMSIWVICCWYRAITFTQSNRSQYAGSGYDIFQWTCHLLRWSACLDQLGMMNVVK